MCVIIKRNPNIEIPEDKLRSACIVNPDGYGISVVDRGKLETFKIYEGKNDPERILKRLEDAKDHLVYLHLRYTTAGKTDTTNCHPFQSFKHDDYEIQFMHNGTLTSFKNDENHSDTWHFNEEVLKPLFKAFYALDGEIVLSNPTVEKIIKEFKGSSAFTIYDSNGVDLILGNTSCKQHDGWWSSNEYSFNRTHRTPASAYSGTRYDDGDPFGYGSRRSGRDNYSAFDKMFPSTPAKTGVTVVSSTTASPSKKEKEVLKEQAKATGYAITQAKKNGMIQAYHTPPTRRSTFVEMAELDDLKDVMVLSEDELFDLVSEQPVVATALLMDLIYELYKKDQSEKRAKTNQTHIKVAS